MAYWKAINPYNRSTERVYFIGEYESVSDFRTNTLEYIKDNKNWRLPNKAKVSILRDWLIATYKAKVATCENEIDQLVADFQKFRKNNGIQISGEVSPGFSVSGQVVDLGRLLSGDPECMIDFFQESEENFRMLDIKMRFDIPRWTKPGRVKDTVNGGFINDGMERLFGYYTPILDMIDNLEAQGVRCRITAIVNSIDTKNFSPYANQTMGSIRLKEYGEAFDIKSFCSIFMQTEIGHLVNMHTYMISKQTKSNVWCNADIYFSSVCEYMPNQPDTVIIPSAFHFSRNGWKYLSGRELLNTLGYPAF